MKESKISDCLVINRKSIEEIESLLMYLEDVIKGADGDRISNARQLLSQSLPLEDVVMDAFDAGYLFGYEVADEMSPVTQPNLIAYLSQTTIQFHITLKS